MSLSCDFVAPIRRSKEVKAVCSALRTLVERGVIRGFQEGKLRVGRMPLDVEWPNGYVSRLRIDIEAATLTFIALIETGASSATMRELKALLRAAQAPGREQQSRIDPARALPDIKEQSGSISLSIVVTRGEYEYCTQRLVELAREALALVPGPMPLAHYRAALVNQ